MCISLGRATLPASAAIDRPPRGGPRLRHRSAPNGPADVWRSCSLALPLEADAGEAEAHEDYREEGVSDATWVKFYRAGSTTTNWAGLRRRRQSARPDEAQMPSRW